MRILLLLSLLFLSSCDQSSNSNTFDRSFSDTVGIDRSTDGGERLYKAYAVLKSNCMSCHSGYHNDWSSFQTNQAWVNSGLIESGDAYSSALVIRLKNTGGNMPKDNSQMSEENFDRVIDWVDNI